MKKTITIICCLLLALAMTACGSQDNVNNEATNSPDVSPSNTPANDPVVPSSAPANDVEDSLALLTKIWETWPEDAKFPVSGGDAEAFVMDAPGVFSIADPAALDASLAFPESEVSKIDDAASLTHMMNANVFTAGVFRLKDASEADAVADAVLANLENREWLCGFPEEYLLAVVDQYLICSFGEANSIATLQQQLNDSFENARIISQGSVEIG